MTLVNSGSDDVDDNRTFDGAGWWRGNRAAGNQGIKSGIGRSRGWKDRIVERVSGAFIWGDQRVGNKEVVSGILDIERVTHLSNRIVWNDDGKSVEPLARVVEVADDVGHADRVDRVVEQDVVVIENPDDKAHLRSGKRATKEKEKENFFHGMNVRISR